jgi:aminoglycoside phosphotransferase (APT) family kinase protein
MRVADGFLDLVCRHFPGADLLSVDRLIGGVSAVLSKLTIERADGETLQLVLRQHGPRHCGHPAALEYELLRSLCEAGLPVPKALAFEEPPAGSEWPYLLLDYVTGTTEIPEDAVEAHIAAMADQLAVIHATPIIGLPPLPDRLDPIPEILHFLPQKPEWDDLRAALGAIEVASYAGSPVLLHGDYWPKNVLWQDGRIAAIIDWEDAAVGDPLSDVACACLELSYLYGASGAENFQRAYAKYRAIDPFRFALWQIYVAAAGHYSMGNWGLEPAREARMREVALASIGQAGRVVLAGVAE